MSKLTAHISADDLLRLADGELSPRETEQAKAHLAACWQCRAQLEEMEQAIALSVRYRDSLYQRCFPSPPAPWCDMQQRLAALDAAPGSASFFERVQEKLGALARGLVVRPRIWAPAMAALLAVAIIVDQFQNAPSVRAAALLQQATAAADSRASKARRIQLRTRTQRLARTVGENTQDSSTVLAAAERRSLSELEGLFRTANYDWNDPLSARAFQSWRAGLAEKIDEVVKVSDPRSPEGDCFELRTSTDHGTLEQASLRLRVADLQPVESKLSFRGFGPVEISELSDQPTAASSRTSDTFVPPPTGPVAPPVVGESTPVTTPATPADELRVYAALHELGADLGEPVEVRRSGDRVLVEGMGVAPEMQQKLQRELAAMPKVQVDFSLPPAAGSQPSATETRSTASSLPHPLVVRWQEAIAKELGGRSAVDRLGEKVLERMDRISARAHAVRNLASRFPDPKSLDEVSRQTLMKIRIDHAQALQAEVGALRQELIPVHHALRRGGALADYGGGWPEVAHTIFGLSRDVEAKLAILFGGATGAVTEEFPTQLFDGLHELADRTGQLVQ
ncbi:MAG: hypothetical protein JNK87_31410 [Bryobacterales bacterium]|nr:hypothetical protein [Bryobacterales bacterium]